MANTFNSKTTMEREMPKHEDGRPKFYNYPQPRLGPDIPYSNPPHPIPVLRGVILTVLANALASLGFVQQFFWTSAGFNTLRTLKPLEDYDPRYNPAVVPIEDNAARPSDVPPAHTFSRPYGKDLPTRFSSVSDYHELYRSGKLTPTAVVEALLPLIRRDISPPGKHSIAFIDSKVDLIVAAAEASTQRYKNGTPLGVLDGVPVAVKDEMDVDGYKKCLGSAKDFTLAQGGTSWAVKMWQDAGAVMMGKTNMHELGLDTTNNNPIHGTPRNPHNQNYYTGGSSGGSGYVVGAGLVPIALGNDGGGSIRVPASYCGVYGLKTSHERVSGLPSIGFAGTNGVIGPLAGTMEDLEIAYRVMATPDPSSGTSSLFPTPRQYSGERHKVLGIDPVWFERAEAPVKALCRAAIEHYKTKLGYTVVDVKIPLLPEGQLAHAMTILSEIQNSLRDGTSGLTPANKILVSVGLKTPADDFLQAQKLRNLLMSHLAALFQTHPGLVLLTPTTPEIGWHISGGAGDLKHGVSDGSKSVRTMEYVWLANFTGLPSLTAPAGYADPVQGEGKIPVGLMATGEWGSEDALIEWGREAEAWLNEQVEGGRRRPETWVDTLALAQQGGKTT